MSNHKNNFATDGDISKNLGEYLGCDPEQIDRVLDQQGKVMASCWPKQIPFAQNSTAFPAIHTKTPPQNVQDKKR